MTTKSDKSSHRSEDPSHVAYYELLERLQKEFKGIQVDLNASLRRVQTGLDTDTVTGLGSKFALANHKVNVNDLVVFGDINRFKHYNDKYGHPVGDRIIMEFGKRIEGIISVYPNSHGFRTSGDEFAMIFRADSTKRIQAELEKQLFLVRIDIAELAGECVSMSMGLARYTSQEGIFACLKRAEKAAQYGKANNLASCEYHADIDIRWVNARDTCSTCHIKLSIFGSEDTFLEHNKIRQKKEPTAEYSMADLLLKCPVCGSEL